MERESHYGTVTEALEKLRKEGFTIDFNLKGNKIVANDIAIHPDDFQIVDVYRYEGLTDPADEATVYAIESKSGLKGVLVTGYGNSYDDESTEILRKLHSVR
jgi:hypothetical protein